MKLADVILVIFILLMTLMGRKNGFVKSALGMATVLICGILTVVVYNYLADAGIISAVENAVFSRLKGETMAKLGAYGLIDYITGGVCYAVIFIVVRLAYKFLTGVLDFAMPGFLNSLLGGALGFLKGAVAVFILLAIVFYISGSVPEVVEKIDQTGLISVCYYNNPIVNLINKL